MDWPIKNINISKLLGRHEISWELSPTVNILGGPNGSGKSTILRAIYAALAEKTTLSEGKLRAGSITSRILFKNGESELFKPGI